ncbi:helix-turn-helix domain-containing protein [Hoeflea poritis]|uniref:LysR family transcriptional regulator n=1 Tax=Hoeflea poritis TaxID=2993659 RepID=A0ABT4VT19_9HYPH|nr:LysR family transcriptional regulator [Hoeflea poritis]MDA4847863.1 LysR family transcriptional regulator [Hoeflea poritis]
MAIDIDSLRLELSDLTKLQTKQLLDVVTVAESGSIRRAANRIGVGQSAVSRRIQKLEDYLGVSLFERHASGAQLTQAGRASASDGRPFRPVSV